MVICVSYYFPRCALLYSTMARYQECITTPPDSAIAVQWGIPLSPDRTDRTLATLLQCKPRMLPQGAAGYGSHVKAIRSSLPCTHLGTECNIHDRPYHNAARQTGIELVSLVYWHIFYVICSFVQFSTCSTVL